MPILSTSAVVQMMGFTFTASILKDNDMVYITLPISENSEPEQKLCRVLKQALMKKEMIKMLVNYMTVEATISSISFTMSKDCGKYTSCCIKPRFRNMF